MSTAPKTALYQAYALVTNLILPFAYRSIRRKLKAADVSEDRIRERLGYATIARPEGALFWFHAASVGESVSVLSLIKQMGIERPDLSFLITSGTATSAQVIARRLPPRTLHQFAPLDARRPLERFLNHWHPDAALFVESELWPQMIVRSFEAGIPLALVNARLSEASLKNWAKRPATFKMILTRIQVLLTQTKAMGEALITAGAPKDLVHGGTDIKATSSALPVDPRLTQTLRDILKDRPVWVAASTHDGEEQIILDTHKALLKDRPDLCLILAPRHPERGDAVHDLIQTAGLTHRRRSTGALPDDAQVYLADTVGELGNWYALGKFVFLGGSLSDIGGHNPFEVAQAGLPVITGPYVRNFAESFDRLTKYGGSVTAHDAKVITKQAKLWLGDEACRSTAAKAAQKFIRDDSETLQKVTTLLLTALEKPR